MSACASKTEEGVQNPQISQARKTMPDLGFYIDNTQSIYKLGSPINLNVTLTNHASESLDILPWGTPLERAFNSDMFHVSQAGISIPYTGIMVKRGTPSDSDYLSIAPEKSLAATIDLSKGYALQTSGTYTITLKPRYLSTLSKDTNNNLIKAESNTIVIQITE